MNTTSRRNRKHFSENTAVKLRKRVRNRGIEEGVFLPVVIKQCTEGKPTSKGKSTIQFELQHLVTKAVFTTLVFEGVAPHYIDEQIIDCILPDDVDEYNLTDLVGGGLMVKLKFNEKNNVTYMNIVEVDVLDASNKKLLQQALKQEKQTKKAKASVIHDVEDELEELYGVESNHGNEKSFDTDDEVEEDDDLDLDIDSDDLDLAEDDEEVCLFCEGRGCIHCEEDHY